MATILLAVQEQLVDAIVSLVSSQETEYLQLLEDVVARLRLTVKVDEEPPFRSHLARQVCFRADYSSVSDILSRDLIPV